MKLILVLMLCALVAAAPKVDKPNRVESNDLSDKGENRWVEQAVNQLIRQLIAYIRRIIDKGSSLLGIPPLDPLELEHFHLVIPAGIINLDLELKNILATGINGFVMHNSRLNLSDLTFDIDVSVPTLDISAESYDMTGDFFTAIPLYGKGKAVFKVEGFRFQAKLFLEQSADGKSVLIGKIENASFQIPTLKSELSGAIGGGDIDDVVNAMISEVIVDYVNRFQGAISAGVAKLVPTIFNPVLEKLDTWRYIDFVLRPRELTHMIA